MELWIRSQNKESLVKVGSNLTIDDTNSIFCDYDSFFIGTYKSKGRALEVLDEINNYKDKLEKAHFLGMTESEFVSSTFAMPQE